MRWLASGLEGYSIEATDDTVGAVADLLFDDRAWAIRWIEIDTGNWLPGRRVLVPPSKVGAPDPMLKSLSVDLTRKQIEESPGVAADEPVSRQMEVDYYRYIGGAPYWAAGVGYPSLGPAGSPSRAMAQRLRQLRIEHGHAEPSGDPTLRSASEVTGYFIHATDGSIGHVEDFVVDDEGWSIRYMIVDTVNWWPGKKVLVAPEWILGVNWTDQQVSVALDRDAIKASPEWKPGEVPDRDYEDRLHRHYGLEGYWV